MIAYEVNFDSLVGPTHFFGGLSYGNLASMAHQGEASNPRQAALQGLEKMRMLHSLGVKQAVLPPHERPYLPLLKAVGFTGSIATILSQALKKFPYLLEQVSSSSNMWTANAATMTPAIDCIDNHTHFTPANLITNFHRSIEAFTTQKIFEKIFSNPVFFKVHSSLPRSTIFSDEGAANHTRFAKSHAGRGVHLFCYGQELLFDEWGKPLRTNLKFPGRQTLEASESLIRLHQIFPNQVVLAKQNPAAINAGVFHNDVISVGNLNVFLVHERSFTHQKNVLENLKQKVAEICDTELIVIEIANETISLEDAIKSYLFNSQLVSLPDGSMTLVAPKECLLFPHIERFLNDLIDSRNSPIKQVGYIDLSESMRNGGGPACLRLRAVLTEQELKEIPSSILFSESLYQKLSDWINAHYPEFVSLKQLGDSSFYEKNCHALDELSKILGLDSIYSFQPL
ncbi:MAG: N-succinylarginine dihydrolase [Parachlamydiaceae bacterium]